MREWGEWGVHVCDTHIVAGEKGEKPGYGCI